MKILTLGLWAAALHAQVALDAPRFGCVVTSGGEVVEFRGLRRNLVAVIASDGPARSAICGNESSLVLRGHVVYANGDPVVEIDGDALLAVAGRSAAILDLGARRLHWSSPDGWRVSAARIPAEASGLAVDGVSAWILSGDSIFRFDLESGAVLAAAPVPAGFEHVVPLPGGRVAGLGEGFLHVCGADACERTVELPSAGLELQPLNSEWVAVRLAGGALLAAGDGASFFLPGVSE